METSLSGDLYFTLLSHSSLKSWGPSCQFCCLCRWVKPMYLEFKESVRMTVRLSLNCFHFAALSKNQIQGLKMKLKVLLRAQKTKRWCLRALIEAFCFIICCFLSCFYYFGTYPWTLTITYQSPTAAGTNHHSLSGLEQQELIRLQFCWPQVSNGVFWTKIKVTAGLQALQRL